MTKKKMIIIDDELSLIKKMTKKKQIIIQEPRKKETERRTHMAREVKVNMEWKLQKKKYSQITYKTISLCQPKELFLQPTYWLYQEGYLTKRWKHVTCKVCLARQER